MSDIDVNHLNKDKNAELPEVIQFKIVYWGPGESGKTTNFLQLQKLYKNNAISKGFQIATTDKRTLWQDSKSLSWPFSYLGKKYMIVVHLVTCTGQERFLSTREYVLGGADGIIFVADSDPKKQEQNLRSFNELIAFINGRDIPVLIQLNKQDLPNAIKPDDLKQLLGLPEDEVDEDGHLIVYPAIAKDSFIDPNKIFADLMEKILYRWSMSLISFLK
ncbi:MAG: ADP-ribosylation factor-like protein [Promethearchaeota archaeon]